MPFYYSFLFLLPIRKTPRAIGLQARAEQNEKAGLNNLLEKGLRLRDPTTVYKEEGKHKPTEQVLQSKSYIRKRVASLIIGL